ncbi:hypothetical protein [Streptomyces virginiae]|uniref:hypothetical protein n=1 Tax=Streptomyces virginiae TaxID=1961 RepID=UPI0036FD45A5
MTKALPPTREELKAAVERQSEHEANLPRTGRQISEVRDRILRDWREANGTGQAYPDVQSFIRSVAANASVTNEDRGDVRAFWSYKSQPEGSTEEVGHQYVAQACGESRGYQVLEDSPAGRRLDSYHLWQPEVRQMLTRDFDVPSQEAVDLAPEVWSTVSRRYAEAAEGPVVVFAADIGEKSVLGKDELPQLLAHERVGKDGVEFALPSPRHEHLPPEVDELIADDFVRCQVRMEDFDPKKTTPKEFAKKLAAVSVPENRRAEHQAALSQLMSADSYPELKERPAAAAASGQDRAHGYLVAVDIPDRVPSQRPTGHLGHGVVNPVPELAPRTAGVER